MVAAGTGGMYIIFVRIFTVFLMILAGVLARKRNWIDAGMTRHLAVLTTTLLYPALILATMLNSFTFKSLLHHWTLPAGAFLIMAIGFGLGIVSTLLLPFPNPRQKHGFIFQCTMNNYSFLPMPLALMFWGETGVALLIFSTIGSELAVWTLGVVGLTGGKLSYRTLKHLVNPPIMAVFATVIILLLLHIFERAGMQALLHVQELGSASLAALDIFGKGTIPLAMLVAGSRMADLNLKHLWGRAQAALVVMRLVLIPAAAVLLIMALPFNNETRQVLFLVAVMPSAITSVVLSEIYRADSDFAASCVLLTHVVSLLTIPLWLAMLIG